MRIQKYISKEGGVYYVCVVFKSLSLEISHGEFMNCFPRGGGRGAAPFMPHVPLDLPIEMKVLVYISIE